MAKTNNTGKIKETTQKIITAFESNDLPEALAQVFVTSATAGVAPSDGWSTLNRMSMAFSGHEEGRTFNGWKRVGRVVNKGQKAFYILQPRNFTKKVKNDSGEEETVNVMAGFKISPRFGYEQTRPMTNEELAKAGLKAAYTREEAKKAQREFIDKLPLVEVAKSWGIEIELFNASGSPRLGYMKSIFNIPLSIGVGVENIRVWAHELLHAADALAGNLNSDKVNAEVVADLGGCVLLNMLGCEVESDMGSVWQYIKLQSKDDDKATLQLCQNLADRIEEALTLIFDTAKELQVA